MRSCTPTRNHRPRLARGGVGGQATVEFALVLPMVLLAVLGVLQVGLLVRDQVAVVHAAREAARAAAVDPDPRAVQAVVGKVLPEAIAQVGRRPAVGEEISVTVAYRARTDVPLIGPLVPDPVLRADAVMRVER